MQLIKGRGYVDFVQKSPTSFFISICFHRGQARNSDLVILNFSLNKKKVFFLMYKSDSGECAPQAVFRIRIRIGSAFDGRLDPDSEKRYGSGSRRPKRAKKEGKKGIQKADKYA
jgi:hypothetical protein